MITLNLEADTSVENGIQLTYSVLHSLTLSFGSPTDLQGIEA
jgi:hypothetical protein